MAAQDHPSQRAPPSRALLRAARRAGCLAQASAARTPCREQEAQGLEIAPFDSGPRSDPRGRADRKSTRLNSSHGYISYAVFCLKQKNKRVNIVPCTVTR